MPSVEFILLHYYGISFKYLIPIYGYPKINVWTSKHKIMDIQNLMKGQQKINFWLANICENFFLFITQFLDIQKYNSGYLWLNFWISKNTIQDIFNSSFGYPKIQFRISITQVLDIQKLNSGYLYNDFWMLNIGYPSIFDTHNYMQWFEAQIISPKVRWSKDGAFLKQISCSRLIHITKC